MPELEAVFADLQAVLADERRAIARLDAGGIAAAVTAKQAIAERLRLALHEPAAFAATARREVARTLSRLRAAADVNRALLTDAAATLAALHAVPIEHGTYDRRAVLRRAAREDR